MSSSTSSLLISDHSKEKLQEVPSKVLEMTNLKMLFLEGNFLYKLPEDFFWKLAKLVWLDLRNNQLESIPTSIAHHDHLENLLLTNNNLKKLPNELGTVPKLKALQVSENPLVYPARKVIVEGTKAIKTFLKHQYEKLNQTSEPTGQQNERNKKVDEQEELIKVDEFTSSEESMINKAKYRNRKRREGSRELRETIKRKIADPRGLQPTLYVKKLSHTNICRISEKGNDKNQGEPLKIIHKISRNGDTISLTSSMDKVGIRNKAGKVMDGGLKQGWLNQLRILLSDQERILQQERSLRALSDWRVKRRIQTPKIFYDNKPAPPPYATYPEYEGMPTREALAAQLNTFFKEKGLSRAGGKRGEALDIDKLINDLVEQLKEMEQTYKVARSPRSEIAEAEKQIKTITEIHKKLLQLKSMNNLAI